MNFFEHQRKAKSKTTLLLVYFSLSVLSLIFITNLGVTYIIKSQSTHYYLTSSFWELFFTPKILIPSTLGTLIIIGLGSGFKILSLSGGGASVCKSVGAKEINGQTKDHHERVFLNIVEEISIASGVPIPRTFILDDPAINAFAAGSTIKDAAICVTTGSIKKLTRDELQGVIAHEYGHIFNGDMKLNIRLMGIIFGIICISKMGEILARSNRSSRYSRRSKDGNQLALVGFGLYVIGGVGIFFASLIKSAISREREYLADASAVQYTRNPQAVVNVFKKIICLEDQQLIQDALAKDVSHMFFAKGFQSFFATHPPLEERISRIDKKFNFKRFQRSDEFKELAKWVKENNSPGQKDIKISEQISALSEPSAYYVPPVEASQEKVKEIEDPICYIEKLMAEIPNEIKELAHSPFGAQTLLLCIVINKKPEQKEKDLALIDNNQELKENCFHYLEKIHTLENKLRLPLIEMAVRSIKVLKQKELNEFKELFEKVIISDGKIELHEALISSALNSFENKSSSNEDKSIRKLRVPAQAVLSALLYISYKKDSQKRQESYANACKQLGIYTTQIFDDKKELFKSLNSNLKQLSQLKLNHKEKFITLLVDIILEDNKVTYKEQEIVHFIAQALNVPMPLIQLKS